MRPRNFTFLLALLVTAACDRAVNRRSNQLPSATSQASSTPGQQAPSTSPMPAAHPNQVAVSLGKVSSETARLNPRIAEAYSPAKVNLQRTAAAPAGFPGSEEAREESSPVGMRWVVVVVDHDAAQGEVSIQINKIRLVDSSNRPYRLISFGGPDSSVWDDLRDYDKYKMVEPQKMIMQSPAAGQQTLLFAVSSKADKLTLEF